MQVPTMIKTLFIVFFSGLILGCSSKEKASNGNYSEISDFFPEDTLFRISKDHDESPNVGYINQKGDTIIPYGKFAVGFSDTILTYGIVLEQSDGHQELIGINQRGERLYEVVWFDNGPDYIEDGMFRISRHGKIGYANTRGEIVIKPQFACAQPFEKGKAQVTYQCDQIRDGDHSLMQSDHWFYIDKNGRKIP